MPARSLAGSSGLPTASQQRPSGCSTPDYARVPARSSRSSYKGSTPIRSAHRSSARSPRAPGTGLGSPRSMTRPITGRRSATAIRRPTLRQRLARDPSVETIRARPSVCPAAQRASQNTPWCMDAPRHAPSVRQPRTSAVLRADHLTQEQPRSPDPADVARPRSAC